MGIIDIVTRFNIMRLWSVNFKFLDTKGLTALWRESLLARNCLMGLTKGYKNHPQLNRFKIVDDPINAINVYLWNIYEESEIRGFKYNKSKLIDPYSLKTVSLDLDINQLKLEINHLYNKLLHRDYDKALSLKLAVNTESIEELSHFKFFNVVNNPNLINIEARANPVK